MAVETLSRTLLLLTLLGAAAVPAVQPRPCPTARDEKTAPQCWLLRVLLILVRAVTSGQRCAGDEPRLAARESASAASGARRASLSPPGDAAGSGPATSAGTADRAPARPRPRPKAVRSGR